MRRSNERRRNKIKAMGDRDGWARLWIWRKVRLHVGISGLLGWLFMKMAGCMSRGCFSVGATLFRLNKYSSPIK